MTFRTRVGVALGVAAILPLLLLALGVRREMTTRLEREAGQRVAALVEVLGHALAAELDDARVRTAALARGLATDNRLRLALRGDPDERRWLLDWAGDAAAPTGLVILRLHDSDGRVLSSGHFRNEYDRVDTSLITVLRGAAGGGLVRLDAPDGQITAIAAVDSLRLGARTLYLVGGVPFDSIRAAALVPSGEVAARLVYDQEADVVIPGYDAVTGQRGTAGLVVIRDPKTLRALRQGVDQWFAAALALTVLLAAILSAWFAARVSRPLADLAEKTTRLDLDHLEQNFASEREDEVGVLGNLLDAMSRRLRMSAVRLRDAERRAATGDMARQVTHDIRNGLAPIRHVLRHLGEVAEREPERMAGLYRERQPTLEASVGYLDQLARNYARLAPAPEPGPTDLSGLLRDLGGATITEGVEVEVRVEGELRVRADPIALRRIVENLTTNAVEALDGRPGRVSLTATAVDGTPAPRVRLAIADTGRGMTREELDRAFDDFHTTRPGGTGLGLSVVRRLVGDLGGTLRVETAPGQGSTFLVELPAA